MALPLEIIDHIMRFVREEDRIWFARVNRTLWHWFSTTTCRAGGDAPFYTGVRSFATPMGRLEAALSARPRIREAAWQQALRYHVTRGDVDAVKVITTTKLYDWVHPGFMVLAARGGHVRMLQWLRGTDCARFMSDVCLVAAGAGHIPVLEWAVACRYRCGEQELLTAHMCYQPHAVMWIRRYMEARR
jgi:hypothetical protein